MRNPILDLAAIKTFTSDWISQGEIGDLKGIDREAVGMAAFAWWALKAGLFIPTDSRSAVAFLKRHGAANPQLRWDGYGLMTGPNEGDCAAIELPDDYVSSRGAVTELGMREDIFGHKISDAPLIVVLRDTLQAVSDLCDIEDFVWLRDKEKASHAIIAWADARFAKPVTRIQWARRRFHNGAAYEIGMSSPPRRLKVTSAA